MFLFEYKLRVRRSRVLFLPLECNWQRISELFVCFCIVRSFGTKRNTPSFQTGFNLVSAAVVCDILQSISGLEPSSVITEPRYLKLVTFSSFCQFIFYLCVDATGAVCHQLGLCGNDLHAVGCGGFVETLN